MIKISTYGATDVGKKRSNNEDAFAILDSIRLYMVADGMGGHSSGEIASRLAVEEVSSFFREVELTEDSTWPYSYDDTVSFAANKLRTAIAGANRRIQDYARENPRSHGMGTTIVSVLVDGDKMTMLHVGDSRAYVLKKGKLTLLTTDHSWINDQVSHGFLTQKEAVNHPFRNVITRALGTKDQANPDVQEIKLDGGERFLLCTDGLNSMVGDEKIREVLETNSSLEAAANRLIELANENGGEDNITVVILDVAKEDS